ncbi:2-phospho-L-lactate transferase [uncultured Cohaesibacter sp.]|uniref:2-phospho-L-lactate transferase n=1 Tax=uncultured Cohaesibacter sp. TaxID=1002546 RepID=UPI00292F0D3D|nr:2-phospho-L-lactate transferase [uncultured Cohaesibacter sp.]
MSEVQKTRVTLLAGGVGGAKMAEGLAALDDIDLTIIGNVADDDAFHDLWVSPDIDTLTYSLAGLIDRSKGWGVADEGNRALDVLKTLGEDTWMFLGDRDFGLHIYRTMRRGQGDRPSDIAADVARAFGVGPKILLPTDDIVQTRLETDIGELGFQDYFVREQCKPDVSALHYVGASKATPTDEALEALALAEIIVVAPSNPVLSIAPILAIPGMTEALKASSAHKIGVSPFIAGKVVKGPAAKVMASLGLRADSLGVAEQYQGLIDILVIDDQDKALVGDIEALGIKAPSCDILMKDAEDKKRLARQVMDWALSASCEGGAE